MHFLQSPKKRLEWEADQLAATRSTWNGQGTWIPLRLILRSGGEAELGLSDEQKQRLSFLYKDDEMGAEWFQKMHQNPAPEYTQLLESIQKAEIPGDPYYEKATEEQKMLFAKQRCPTSVFSSLP